MFRRKIVSHKTTSWRHNCVRQLERSAGFAEIRSQRDRPWPRDHRVAAASSWELTSLFARMFFDYHLRSSECGSIAKTMTGYVQGNSFSDDEKFVRTAKPTIPHSW